MKKTIHLLLFIVLLLSAPEAMAQVVSICAGQDSVRLRLENYQYGKIQWMSSYDNENWELIEDATDTVYEFMPEENKYYRAQVFFNDCEPVFSATSYVQTLPKPFAGTDKTLSTGSGIYLSASTQPGSIGQWDILSGVGGVLANDTSAYSFFYGSDTTYLLRWTMTNACGSRSDTLKIRYVETVYYPDIVYVDSTDQVLSDSAEMVNGHYRIIFSDSSVVVTDSSVLIGSLTKAFFEKVEHVQMVGDTCIMETHPATLDDILVYGVLNAAEVHYIDTTRHAPMPYILLDHLPTRAEMQIPEIRNGHYRIVEEGELRDGDDVFSITFDSPTNISFSGTANIQGYKHGEFTPNFQFEYVKTFGTTRLKFGIENGRMGVDLGFLIAISGEVKLPLISPPGVPLPPPLSFITLDASLYLALSGNVEFTWDFHTALGLTAMIVYENNIIKDYLFNYCKKSYSVSSEATATGGVEIKFGAELLINLTGALQILKIGPFIDCSIGNSWQWKGCFPPLREQSISQPFIDFKGGVKAGIKCKWLPNLGFELYKQCRVPFGKAKINPYYVTAPMGKETIVEDNAPYIVTVQVQNSEGHPTKNYPVHFVVDNGCGSVGDGAIDEWVNTNDDGYAITEWIPSPSGNKIQFLKAEVLGCSSNIIGSPITFIAKDKCFFDNFRIQPTKSNDNGNICFHLDNIAYPKNTYSWSTNGIDYHPFPNNNTYPFNNKVCIPAQPEIPVIFYAKNQDGCVVTCSEVLDAVGCDNPILCLNYTIENNKVALEPTGGHPGYSCSIDGNSCLPYILLSVDPGDHVLRVEDYIGCSVEETITIGIPITVSFNPNCADYSGVMLNQSIYANVATSLNSNTYARDGYTFIGWNTQSDGSGIQYEDMGTVTLTQDITLYAQWGNEVNRITFHANGGVGTMNQFLAQHGTTITLPQATYTHPCLDFREWNTIMDGTGVTYQNMGSFVLNSDMDLYAQWDSAVSGTVYFHPNGAPDCSFQQQVFHKCISSALAPFNCHYHAFVFMGWNTEPNGGGTSYEDQEVILPVGDLQLYAQWRPANMCHVSFDANGGTGNIDPISGFEAETVQLPSTTPTKGGYHFLFWNTAADGSGTSYYPNSTMYLSSSVTLFAQWERNYYTVTFHANGGTGTMNPQHIYEDSLTALSPNTFTRSGNYTFSHWSTNETGSGTHYEDQEQILITSDLALYAQWISSSNTNSCQVSSFHSNETVVNGRLTSVSDHEGNVYPVVQMNGNSCWLRTNMRATTSPTTGASLVVRPGNLYNWYAATDNGTVRGICPYGWHVPISTEWQSGVSSIGAPVYFSGSGWEASSTPDSPGDYSNESRNITNFSLLPSGKYFINDGMVTGTGTEAMLWLNNTPWDGGYARYVKYTHQSAYPTSGYASASCYYASLRCVRD